MTQRELAFQQWGTHHVAHVSADGQYRSLTYTIDRLLWLKVNQHVGAPLPIHVEAVNLHLDQHRITHIREFPNTVDGWNEANTFVRDLMVTLELDDRADCEVDHYIGLAKSVLHECQSRQASTNRKAA